MKIRRKNTIAWIKRFSDHGRWYADIVEFIRKTYADPVLFANLLAATSPRKTVKANWILANRIYREFKSGKPYSRQGLMPCHLSNIEKSLAGLPLSGNKVKAFAANLCGDFSQVTIDVWLLRYFGLDEKKALSDKTYEKISGRVRKIAKRIGTSPAACQAILWTISRFNYGYGSSSFTAETKQTQFEFMG